MKCPLITAGWNATRGGDKAYLPDCLEKECAWWDEVADRCAVKTIAANEAAALSDLEGIRDKMPASERKQ